MKKKKETKQTIRVFCDGAGSRPDGKGSGFAWVREDTGEKHVERVDGLTNNQAEYRAILSAVRALPSGSKVEVLSDSSLAVNQLAGLYRVRDSDLLDLWHQVRILIQNMALKVTFLSVPRKQNKAGKLI